MKKKFRATIGEGDQMHFIAIPFDVKATFGKARALGGYASALVYLGLGLFTALTDPRPR